MAKVIGVAMGVGNIVMGVMTGNFFQIAQGVAMTVSALSTPKNKQQARQASETQLSLGESPRTAIFGEAATGGSLVDGFNYGGKNGTDWEVLRIALADHRCAALTGFYVNDKLVPFSADGAVAGYSGQLMVWWRPGTEDQDVPAVLVDHGGYTAADNLAGVAHVVVAYKADDPKDKTPTWSAGRPRFLWVVKGALCYSARKDSTAGGSGAHRWDDPATWEWTDNPIDCRYKWVRGVYACDRIDQPDMLLVGRGLSATEAPPERTFAPANLCDEAVPLKAGGTEKRYVISAVIAADDQFDEVEEKFAAAMGGVIIQPEGGVEIEPGHAKSPVAYITDDDIVVGSTVTFSDYRSEADEEWVNTVVPRYIAPDQKWTEHAAPIRRSIIDVMADGGAREETLTLSFARSGTQAQRCGEIRRRMGRLQRTATVTLSPAHAGLEEGDWIVWTSARRTKGLPVTFRVEGYSLGQNWQNTLTLREIAASAYSWTIDDELVDQSVAQQQTPPTEGTAPDVGAWTLTAETTGGSSTSAALVISGAVDGTSATAIVFEYRIAGATDWTDAGTSTPDVTRRSIPVLTDRSYEAAVSYVAGGVVGDRLVLGPVSTSTATLAPGPTTDMSATGGAGQITVNWRNPGSANYSYTRAFYGTTAVFGAASAMMPDDAAGTLAFRSRTFSPIVAGTYYVWTQAFSAAGIASSPTMAAGTVVVT